MDREDSSKRLPDQRPTFHGDGGAVYIDGQSTAWAIHHLLVNHMGNYRSCGTLLSTIMESHHPKNFRNSARPLAIVPNLLRRVHWALIRPFQEKRNKQEREREEILYNQIIQNAFRQSPEGDTVEDFWMFDENGVKENYTLRHRKFQNEAILDAVETFCAGRINIVDFKTGEVI